MNVINITNLYLYNFKNDHWIEKAQMKQNRDFAACTVFEGKIVVTGGTDNWYKLNSVEAYDHYENKWTYLPDMIERRYYHDSVSMGNKMFVIGGGYTDGLGCEVFDSFSRKFTSLVLLE